MGHRLKLSIFFLCCLNFLAQLNADQFDIGFPNLRVISGSSVANQWVQSESLIRSLNSQFPKKTRDLLEYQLVTAANSELDFLLAYLLWLGLDSQINCDVLEGLLSIDATWQFGAIHFCQWLRAYRNLNEDVIVFADNLQTLHNSHPSSLLLTGVLALQKRISDTPPWRIGELWEHWHSLHSDVSPSQVLSYRLLFDRLAEKEMPVVDNGGTGTASPFPGGNAVHTSRDVTVFEPVVVRGESGGGFYGPIEAGLPVLGLLGALAKFFPKVGKNFLRKPVLKKTIPSKQSKPPSPKPQRNGETEVPKKEENVVDGYRSVSKAEADDIAENGFRPKPDGRSMQDKWFSESHEGAEKFKQYYPDLDEVVNAKVPREVYDRSYKHPNIDSTGPGFCVSCDDLPHIKAD